MSRWLLAEHYEAGRLEEAEHSQRYLPNSFQNTHLDGRFGAVPANGQKSGVVGTHAVSCEAVAADAEAHNGKIVTFKTWADSTKLKQALNRRSKPSYAEAHSNLGVTLKN